jgi:NAD(P)-dependent dehydrogenase (short-subunit alcohol dehydrogenase family)
MDARGKVALITGGKRIGAVVAETLARAGVDVALVYNRSLAEAAETQSAVSAIGPRAIVVQADVVDVGADRRLVSTSTLSYARLDA